MLSKSPVPSRFAFSVSANTTELVAGLVVAKRSLVTRFSGSHSRQSERGEGVISLALAVLIMAALAALMWVAYNTMWKDASDRTGKSIKEFGTAGGVATAQPLNP